MTSLWPVLRSERGASSFSTDLTALKLTTVTSAAFAPVPLGQRQQDDDAAVAQSQRILMVSSDAR
jgi:hypothetical protein